MSKLPFKKKLTDEEEEYETDEEEELEEDLDEEIQSENDERTQVVNTSDLETGEGNTESDDEEEYDVDEEVEEPQNLKEKIQFQIDQLVKKVKSLTKKKKDQAEDDGDEEGGAEDETQADIKKPVNRNKLIIQAVIVLGIVYFVAEEFMKEEEPTLPTPPVQEKPYKKDIQNTDQEAGETPTAEEPTTTSTVPAAGGEGLNESDQGLSEAVPAEDAGSMDFPSDSLNEASSTDDFSTVTETPSMTEDTPPSDDFSSLSETPSVTEDSTSMGTDTTPTDDSPIVSEDLPADSTPGTDFSPSIDSDGVGQGQGDLYGDLASPIENNDGDLTEKILQDLEDQTKTTKTETPTEYVAPPDYEYPGRGLVYNCKAMHWACVDGPSYKTCEENAAYLKENNKAPECYPFNVYETSKGCTAMQNRMVSSGSNTDFCKGF